MALDLPNVAHMAHLSRRSAVRALYEPAVMLPTTVFPLIFFAVLAGGVSAARGIPGFPAVPYTDFAFTAPFIQVSLLAAAALALVARRGRGPAGAGPRPAPEESAWAGEPSPPRKRAGPAGRPVPAQKTKRPSGRRPTARQQDTRRRRTR